MKDTAKIRVVLADDHTLVRDGIHALLDKSEDIAVVGEAANGQEAIDQVRLLSPDVLLLDLEMPGMDGMTALRELGPSTSGTRVVVLSMYSDQSLVRRALQMGASGYVLKGSSREELLLAIRAAQRGDLFLSPDLLRFVVEPFLECQEAAEQADPWDLLTPREHEVLQQVVQGKTSQWIAEDLHVSVKTVEKHRYNLMSKLSVHNLAELVAEATRHHVMPPEAPLS